MAMTGGSKLSAHIAGIAEKLAKGKTLRVGFLEAAKYPDGTNVAQVAFWNEYGTKNAPPRPFFRQTIDAKSPNWGSALGKNLTATGYDTDKAMALVGTGIKDQVTRSIVDFQSPGNAPYTIEKKGFDKPLVDTGLMQRSVDFDVKSGES